MKEIITKSPEETKLLAENLIKKIKKPVLFCLYGDLGAGKTVFAKGIAAGMGIPEKDIKSPTYTFVRRYRKGKKTLYHFDFYRIEEVDELMVQDLEEIFQAGDAVMVMEWPGHIKEILPSVRVDIYFKYIDRNTRSIKFADDLK